MSIENSVVLKRIKFIGKNLKELRRFESMSLEYYLDSFDPIRVATYKIVSTVSQELKHQLPAPEQVAKLLQEID